LFDNTGDSNPGVNNWTAEAQNFTITTPVPSGFLYYRLVITRVGNFDTRPQQPTTLNMKSVQIADFRIVGTPFVDQADAKEVREISSCSRDCQYGVWEGCTYDTTNKKWIQNRQKTEAVGNGAVCDVSQYKRDCPNTASWSGWGAFKKNNTYFSSGAQEQFEAGKTYSENGVEKQVRYAKPTSNQGCSDNLNVDSMGMCYQSRDYWNKWGECSVQPDGSFTKTRTNVDGGSSGPVGCTNYTNNWKQLRDVAPTGWFVLKNIGTGQGSGKTGWTSDWDYLQPRTMGESTWWSTTTRNGDQRKNHFRALHADNNRCINVVGYCDPWQSWKNDTLVRSCDDNSDTNNNQNFHYDPVSKQITNNSWACNADRLVCLERVDNSIRTRWCDASNKNQKWEFVPV
jgi:hypothetical protein